MKPDITLAAVGGAHPLHLATRPQVFIAVDLEASKQHDSREDTLLCVLKYA